MISKYCRDRNIVGNSRNFAARVLAADESVTPELSKKFFFSMGKYLEAYKGGASGNDVLKKVKELKRHRHRSAPVLNTGEERRGKYDRKRGENVINKFYEKENASASQSEEEDWEEYSEGGGGGSHEEEEDIEGEEEGSHEDEEDIEEGEEVIKGAVWDLVTTFLSKKTGHSPFENQRFLLSDFMEWIRKTKKGEDLPEDHLRMLICRFDDIFLSDGFEVFIVNIVNTEAEGAFKTSYKNATEAAEKFEYGRKAIWTAVKGFIYETTGEKPFECQHFFLSDLQDWVAKKCDSGGAGTAFLNVQQHIDKFDKYSREGDNCWIDEYDSNEDDSD